METFTVLEVPLSDDQVGNVPIQAAVGATIVGVRHNGLRHIVILFAPGASDDDECLETRWVRVLRAGNPIPAFHAPRFVGFTDRGTYLVELTEPF